MTGERVPKLHGAYRHDGTVEATANKGKPNGYAALGMSGTVPLAQLPPLSGGGVHAAAHAVGGGDALTPAAIGAEAAGAVASHLGAADPHALYQRESEKGQPNGYAGLDALGLLPGSILPLLGSGSRFPQTITFGAYLVLTNVGAAYDAIPIAKGLGVADIDFTGVARVDFTVFANKVGTGTQSWQLWNVTDNTELLVINDAAAAGDKTLTGSKTTGLPTGVKRIRLRVKSTVAGDDPVIYGASLRLS